MKVEKEMHYAIRNKPPKNALYYLNNVLNVSFAIMDVLRNGC